MKRIYSYSKMFNPYTKAIIRSIINTAMHPLAATISKLFSKNAIIKDTPKPIAAEIGLAVEVNIVGKVIAANVA